jgi:hypothetical protein
METSVFANLDALRLSPEAAATIGTHEVLTHVPVRKPSRTEWVRVHPAEDMQIATGVFIDREERPHAPRPTNEGLPTQHLLQQLVM